MNIYIHIFDYLAGPVSTSPDNQGSTVLVFMMLMLKVNISGQQNSNTATKLEHPLSHEMIIEGPYTDRCLKIQFQIGQWLINFVASFPDDLELAQAYH